MSSGFSGSTTRGYEVESNRPGDSDLIEGELGPEEFHKIIERRLKMALVNGSKEADNPDLSERKGSKR